MSRDGLLPEVFSKVHPKFHTPYVITILTGIFVSLFAAFFPVGKLADISNSGTLFAFAAVSVAVMMLRKTDPHRRRPFRTPGLYFRSEEHTSELQSLMRISYAVFCLKKKKEK